MTPSRKRSDTISRNQNTRKNSNALRFANKKLGTGLEKPYTFPPSCSLHPVLLLVADGGLFGLRRRGKKKKGTREEGETTSDLEETTENKVEPGEPVYEVGWKRAREMQTKFMSMIIDEAHERYLQNAKPPEDIKRLLESYVEALKEDIVDCLRQRE